MEHTVRSSKHQLTIIHNAKALLWEKRENRSIEYLTLQDRTKAFVIQGTVIMLLEEQPTQIMYRLECNKKWQTKQVSIVQERTGIINRLFLKVNNEQVWNENNSIITFATGLFDVDFEISPATNTLPIRRLGLDVGESTAVDAVWVRFPSLKLERLQQRYTRINDKCYKYETPSTRYEAQLEVDNDGLVVHYDNLWNRIM